MMLKDHKTEGNHLSKEEVKLLRTRTESNRWLRIRYASEKKKDIIFHNLLCHFNEETLLEAYHALDGSKALGTDGVSKKVYGQSLEENLKNLVKQNHANPSFVFPDDTYRRPKFER